MSPPMILQNRHSGMEPFSVLRSARDGCSRNTLQVAAKADHCEAAGRRDQLLDYIGLTEADLERQHAAAFQADRRLSDQATDRIQPVRSGKQRQPRLVIANLRL